MSTSVRVRCSSMQLVTAPTVPGQRAALDFTAIDGTAALHREVPATEVGAFAAKSFDLVLEEAPEGNFRCSGIRDVIMPVAPVQRAGLDFTAKTGSQTLTWVVAVEDAGSFYDKCFDVVLNEVTE